jgi:FKBP-type peptidyl-prolyl cis-trans isomerase FkpA
MDKVLRRFAPLMLVAGLSVGIAACGGSSSNSVTPVVDTSGSSAISALKVTDTVVGTGAAVAVNQTVTVNYTGWLYDVKATDLHGTRFDGGTFTFVIGGNVIAGWNQGIPGMKMGGKRTLVIPASLAYGSQGNSSIPANAALVFDVELVSAR